MDEAGPARNAAQVKAGFESGVGPHTVVYVEFDGEFSRASQFYGGKGGGKVLF